jgi:hypothetical protein
MILSFRQGLVDYKPGFIFRLGTTVSITTANGPVVYSVSSGNAEYLITEPVNQHKIDAWTIQPFVDSWLYFDINRNTAVRTFGVTTVEPIFGHTNNFHPLDTIPADQHWFDSTSYKMKVWDGAHWIEYIRVFAGKVVGGTSVEPMHKGSQSSITGQFSSGKILFDGYGKPLKKSDKTFFTSEDQWFVDGSNIQAGRLERDITTALADESMSEFSVVTYASFGRVRLANYEDSFNTAVAMCTNSVTHDEIVNIVFQGSITNPAWNWSTVNALLWIDTNGQLNEIDPHVTDAIRPAQVPVAKVISPNTIIFMQGLGGLGLTGLRGSSGADVGMASSTNIGITRLTVDPIDEQEPIAVGDNDPRNSNARVPLTHPHTSTEITTTSYGSLSAANVQANLRQLSDQKLNLTGGTMLGSLILNTNNPTLPYQAASKQYVDSIATGLHWIDPVCAVNMVSDAVNSPPSNPEFADMYLVPAGGLNAWSGKDNHMVRWTGTSWEDLGDWISGPGSEDRRFGVSITSGTVASGTFTGKDNQVAIWDATAHTWSFYNPHNSDAFYVCNEMSLFKFQQFVYDSIRGNWVNFGGPQSLIPGNQLSLVGNTLNVLDGHSSGLDADTVDGLHASDISPVNHDHDTTYLKLIGGIVSGTLTLNGVNSLIANTEAIFNNGISVHTGNLSILNGSVVASGDITTSTGNMLVPLGTTVVSRDPIDDLEVATKRYVDNLASPSHSPYDLSFFIGGDVDTSDAMLGSVVVTRHISIASTFDGSFALSAQETTGDIILSITVNDTIVGYITFFENSINGIFSQEGLSPYIYMTPGDRINIFAPSGIMNLTGLKDTVITIIGCAGLESCNI